VCRVSFLDLLTPRRLWRCCEAPVSDCDAVGCVTVVHTDRKDAKEDLTTLGHALALLPMHPQLGKMLLFGILLGCLDPMLTLACALAYRTPFVLPLNETDKAAVRRRAARSSALLPCPLAAPL
jgi:HrpA-like RNA helicase